MFTIGSHIQDPSGVDWIVIQTWLYQDYHCLGLIATNGPCAGAAGGVRFKEEESVGVGVIQD